MDPSTEHGDSDGGYPQYADREQVMSAEAKKHRSHLPMPNTLRPRFIAYDAKDPESKFPPIEQLRPPGGAPNVLVVLIDDAGFGSSSNFGGPCQTPNAEKLAAGGLRFTRFHTTALCSPSRQALLTGRNHDSAGMGGITEIATGAPGYCSVQPNTMSPLAKTLKLNGYSTAQFGKCHERHLDISSTLENKDPVTMSVEFQALPDGTNTPNANTTVTGGNGGVAVGWLPGGGAYYAHALSERAWFGVAATSNFGLRELG
jgi:arylsulfatase A-like enzyme